MKKITQKTTATFDSPIRNSMSPATAMPPARVRLLIPLSLLLASFAFVQQTQATEPDTILPNGNTAEGSGVLVSLTSGVWNSGFGFQALNHLTGGNQNTATGLRALSSDINGGFNTATGVLSLFSNTSGFFNSASGAYSLANNTIGGNNTANGYAALYYNTEGDFNTATGFAALYRNTTSFGNTANGYEALYFNTAEANTATGYQALVSNTTGIGNTANGLSALRNNSTGDHNTALGINAGNLVFTASNVIAIGSPGANVSDSCYIGNIWNESGGSQAVYVNSEGKLGAQVSSRRFKDQIKPIDEASEVIYGLKPVSFRYKPEIEPTRPLSFGLIAEEVEKISPDLVTRGGDGTVNTVRYDAVNAMLLNEFLKEHDTIQELKFTVAEQRKEIQALTARLEEQASLIQKVTAQLELNGPMPRTVVENR